MKISKDMTLVEIRKLMYKKQYGRVKNKKVSHKDDMWGRNK